MAEKYADIRKKSIYIGHSSYPGDSRALGMSINQMMKHMFVAGRSAYCF